MAPTREQSRPSDHSEPPGPENPDIRPTNTSSTVIVNTTSCHSSTPVNNPFTPKYQAKSVFDNLLLKFSVSGNASKGPGTAQNDSR